MIIEEDKFCINCKHSLYGQYGVHILLSCKQFITWEHTDKVTGITYKDYSRCDNARFDESKCGPEGNLFEPTFKYKVISIIKGVFK